MRKVPALLASALLLSTIAAGVGPMMATAAAPAVSPRPSIEVKERDEDDLDTVSYTHLDVYKRQEALPCWRKPPQRA